ncbi:MAG: formate/nitrite transporter family protein [Anaerolineae bacterium]
MAENRFDALLPQEIAQRAEAVGQIRASLDVISMLGLSTLAGAFISMGAVFSTIVATGSGSLPYGVGRLLIGLAFCLGLILVVVAGAELFTGNNLIVMAWASGRVSTRMLLRNWGFVYLGNLLGSLITAVIMTLAKYQYNGNTAVGQMALAIAEKKCSLGFLQAIALGMLCNALVCIAVWLTMGGHSITDKILAIIFPITAFVASGFEHSIANMYFIPVGLLIKADAAFLAAAGTTAANFPHLTVARFILVNLLPVTIGNIIGGAGMVGLAYWSIYLRPKRLRVHLTVERESVK